MAAVRGPDGRFIKAGTVSDQTAAFSAALVKAVMEATERQTREIATAILRGYQGTPGILRVNPTRRLPSGNRVGTDPSAPGEPPKQVTGTLQRELDTDTERQGDRAVGRIGYRSGSPASQYAPALEYGTNRMAARPFLRPALDAHKQDFIRRLQRIGEKLG